jgi:hypothetical protein
MPTSLRLVILAGSLLIIANVLYYIHKRRILMANSTGWVCIALLLLFMALFPGIIIRLSSQLGFISPANFVFFVVTGLLTVKTFRDSARMSLMRHKIEELAQEVALANDELERRMDERAD